MKTEIKKFSRGYAVYAGVSRLSKFFKSEEEVKAELEKNGEYYKYLAGSAATSVDNAEKNIIDASTGKTRKVKPYLDKQGRIMHEGLKLAEKLLSILESLKYEKKEDKNGNHELVAKSPQGEVSISVYAHKDGGEEVYLIDIGNKRVFEAGNDNDTISVSKAKQIVDMFIKSRKFNPEKWLKSSSYVDKFLKDIDSGKFKKPLAQAKDEKHLLSTLLSRIMDEVTYYGNYVSNEVPPFADDLLLNFFQSDKSRQIMFSKVARLVTKGAGEFKKIFGSSPIFKGGDSGKSDDDILDKAIDRIIYKNGSTSDDDFWAEMMGNMSIRQKLLNFKGK